MNTHYFRPKCSQLTLAAIISVFIVGCATTSKQASLSKPYNIEGKWFWQQEGPWHGYFVLEKKGDSYTGTLDDISEGTHGDEITDVNISNGLIKFKRIGRHCVQYWEGKLKKENGHLQIIEGQWTDTRWRKEESPLSFSAEKRD
jgi:hypothetical protein